MKKQAMIYQEYAIFLLIMAHSITLLTVNKIPSVSINTINVQVICSNHSVMRNEYFLTSNLPWLTCATSVGHSGFVVRMSDFLLRVPRFKASFCHFVAWIIPFPPYSPCLSSLRRMYDCLGIT